MENQPFIHFRKITAKTVVDVCALSRTLLEEQRHMVADNALSIAQAHFSDDAWFRAVYADDTPIGFIMVHFGSDIDDGIDVPGAYLWRFMIAGPHQKKGYGRKALGRLIEQLKSQGFRELQTSCNPASEKGSPFAFYRKLGFEPNGETFDGEEGLTLIF
jgi:diamine N-acetyltransferase